MSFVCERGQKLPQLLETFRGLMLDDFQKQAIFYLDQGASVFVSAPTGTGKTLIADYIIEKDFRAGKRVFYTAPIKALSNQKYKQFKALVGEENVGIVTGDVVLNEYAPIVLMTTEIFRNMLFESPDQIQDVAHVIFDEIHYIADEERGFVWEESLIFMPETMRFLGLSATVSNSDQLADWMRSLRKEPIYVIKAFERIVPLQHRFFSPETGIASRKRILNYYYQHIEEYEGGAGGLRTRRQFHLARPAHLQLLEQLGPAYLPVLFFVFSRKGTEQCAMELAAEHDYLTGDEKAEVDEIMVQHLEGINWKGLTSVEKLRQTLLKGIAFHHAGMLPVLKDVVEDLFERRLIRVLYATETFAVGVNFPVRTVCFESYRKFDGRNFRPLTNNEYFQMAGRAGRRGIDEVGYVFVNVSYEWFSPQELVDPDESKLEPIQSQFILSYNSVLNLIQNHTDEEIREALQKNLLVFQNRSEFGSIQAEVEGLRKELDELADMKCPNLYTPGCPLQVHDWKKQKSNLEKKVRRWIKSGSNKNVRRLQQAQAEIYRLEQKLAEVPMLGCSAEEIKQCRGRIRREISLLKRQRRLRRMMRAIPDDNQFYELYQKKKELLEALRYVADDELTPPGLVAANLHIQELLVTEFLLAGVFHDFSEDEINALAVCIDYEPRRGENKRPYQLVDFRKPERIVRRLQRIEETLLGETTICFHNHLHELAYLWSQGEDFATLLEMEPDVTEGDLISAFRRAIDLLRQLRRVVKADESLADKLSRCIQRMDRDVVEIRL